MVCDTCFVQISSEFQNLLEIRTQKRFQMVLSLTAPLVVDALVYCLIVAADLHRSRDNQNAELYSIIKCFSLQSLMWSAGVGEFGDRYFCD